jgi:hypothetical protein
MADGRRREIEPHGRTRDVPFLQHRVEQHQENCIGLREWRQAVSERKAVTQCARSIDWYAERYRSYLAA